MDDIEKWLALDDEVSIHVLEFAYHVNSYNN